MTSESTGNGASLNLGSLAEVEEQDLSLSLETSRLGNALVVHCRGRIVYRYEVATLSHTITRLLEQNRTVILDIQNVSAIDSAGLGELVALHMWARAQGSALKLTGITSRVRALLELTNLTSVLEMYATEEYAARTSRPEVA